MTRRHRQAVPLPRKQRGVALLIAMLTVAIGTIIAVSVLWELTLDRKRTEAALATDQAILYLQGAEAWGADILREDLVDSPDSDSLADLWAQALPPLPLEGGTVQGTIEDLQGRFNLNNLVDQAGIEDEVARQQFERLLFHLNLDPLIAPAVVDWLDPDTEPAFPGGAEDFSYSALDLPYRTANTMITSPSELMAIAGINREAYQTLAPYVAALPRGTRINVNTAPPVILAALSDEIPLSRAENLVLERGGANFLDIEASFGGLIEAETFGMIDGVSSHFLLTATVSLGSTQVTMRSILQRDVSGLTRPIFRSLGGY